MQRHLYHVMSLILLCLMAGCSGNKSQHRADVEMNEVDDSTVIIERINNTSDPDTKGVITDFYNTYILGGKELDEDTAAKFCSKRMVRQMAEDYSNEYNDTGMAVWIFRSGQQDGPSSESRVVEVIATGIKQYEVNYFDMGLRCTSRVTMTTENGYQKIDRVQLLNVQN